MDLSLQRYEEVEAAWYDMGVRKYKKLDLPLFDGSNPNGWIPLDEVFQLLLCEQRRQVGSKVVSLEGNALFLF